eukprot:GEMP01045003.1.p1 GENE.GEMP01045003.1~~GEMP01045003.1.p1  ORF type:complete len:177 (+),score=16.95 GEMP01045003.1:29-532(+)
MSNNLESGRRRNHRTPNRTQTELPVKRSFGGRCATFLGTYCDSSAQYLGCDIHGEITHTSGPRRRSRSPRDDAPAARSLVKAVKNALPLAERSLARDAKTALAEVFPGLQATPKQLHIISSEFAKCAHSVYTKVPIELGFQYFDAPGAVTTSMDMAIDLQQERQVQQ